MPTSLEAFQVDQIKGMLDDTNSKIKAILNNAGLANGGRKTRRSKKGRKTRRHH